MTAKAILIRRKGYDLPDGRSKRKNKSIIHMRNIIKGIIISLLLTVGTTKAEELFPGEKTIFHGVAKYSVPIGQGNASVLVPGQPAPGRPWVIAPSLYDLSNPVVANMTRLELELVRRGFHVVAFGLGNTFGAPDTVIKWDAVYNEMTQKYGLNRKVALMGLSREGLAIACWAEMHSENVSCLYMDKAVCDIKSWPGGKLGAGKGSARDWESLLRLYHFETEAEAMGYNRNPVDFAPKLAAAKIPVLYVAGEKDEAVPYAENGARMEQTYRESGGTFRLIMQKGEGHHPHGLPDPWPVADFIQLYSLDLPLPTLVDVAYGPHPRQVLHYWKAKSDKPAPLAFYIHGGGWNTGDRLKQQEVFFREMLDNGISVVSVEYRFISEAIADGEKPPVCGPMSDAARALQFVRSNADKWGIDKQRVGACGGSAGGCTSLWLAFSNDLADPDSNDPVARESTRLMCAATWLPQTSLDPLQMKEWIPNSKYGGHAFGFKGDAGKGISEFDNFLAGRDTILKWIDTYSPYALVTAGDPPVYMYYYTPPSMGQAEKDPTHSSNFGAKLQEKCRKVGIECELVYPGAPDVIHKQLADYFIAKLKKKVNQ